MLGDRKVEPLTGYFGEIIGPKKQLEYLEKREKRRKEKRREEERKRDRRTCQKRNRRKRTPKCIWYVRPGGLFWWSPGTRDFDAANYTRLIREGYF